VCLFFCVVCGGGGGRNAEVRVGKEDCLSYDVSVQIAGQVSYAERAYPSH
jgi:hypothetical protein